MTIRQQGGVFGRNPTFNDITADGYAVFGGDVSFLNASGSIKAFWNSTTSRFGLGTTSPLAILQLREGNPDLYITSDDTGQTDIFFGGVSAPTTGNIKYSDNDKSLRLTANSLEALRLESDGDVNVRLGNLVIGTSGKGIDFSATAGTGTSELFDDYEEGTWTATVGCTGNATTTTTVTAYYTKIGRQVTVSFRDLNDIDTTGLSGFLSVTLPFTCITASVGFIGALIWDSLTYPSGYDLVFPYVANGGSAMAFAIGGSGIADSLLDVSAITSGTTDLKYATLTYFTA